MSENIRLRSFKRNKKRRTIKAVKITTEMNGQ